MDEPKPELLDPETLHMLANLGERRGKDLLGQLFKLFQRQGPESVSKMRQALERSEAAALRDLAHSLKGSYRSIGAPALAEIAHDLEKRAKDDKLEGFGRRVDELEQAFEATRQALETYLSERVRA